MVRLPGPSHIVTPAVDNGRAEEVTRTSERLECEGDARWSSGEWRVAFHIKEDQEGDRFIGYESKRFD